MLDTTYSLTVAIVYFQQLCFHTIYHYKMKKMFIAMIVEKITLYLGSLKTIFNSIQNDKTLISKKSYSLLSSSATISRLLNCS